MALISGSAIGSSDSVIIGTNNYCIGSSSTIAIGSIYTQPMDVMFPMPTNGRLCIGTENPPTNIPVGSIVIQSKPGAKVFLNGEDITDLSDRVETLESTLNETIQRLEALMDMHLLLVRDIKARRGEPVEVSVLGDAPTPSP